MLAMREAYNSIVVFLDFRFSTLSISVSVLETLGVPTTRVNVKYSRENSQSVKETNKQLYLLYTIIPVALLLAKR